MKISVITPCFNSSSTIVDTIESVLSQTYSDIEHVIVDGGSTDGTIDIIRRYEPRYEGRLRWVSEPDKGLYDAMNKGIRMASGDVVGVLNSDDFFASTNALSKVAEAIRGGSDAVCANLNFVARSDTSKIMRRWQGCPKKSFASGWHPAHPTFYVHKDLIERYGAFDTQLRLAADFELMLRLIEKHGISVRHLDFYMVNMRTGGVSTSGLKSIIRGNKEVLRAFEINDLHVSLFYPIRRLLPKAISLIKHISHSSRILRTRSK